MVEETEKLIRRALRQANAQGGHVGSQLLLELSECADRLGVVRTTAETLRSDTSAVEAFTPAVGNTVPRAHEVA